MIALAHNKAEIEGKAHAVIEKYAERGLRSLAVARQVRSFTLLLTSDLFCMYLLCILLLLYITVTIMI